jgi:hypothetical protein
MRVPSGNVPERWFSPSRGGSDGAGLRFRLATSAALAVARAAGARVPAPEYLPLDQAVVIARWAADAIRRRGACGIRASVSKALRIALAAREAGIDLTGAAVSIGSEPPTVGKVERIRASGARVFSHYYVAETGPVGVGCTTSADPNDQHLCLDRIALIQAPRAVPGFDVTVPSFHITTLLPSAPKLMLNVESDDYGVVETGPCGCPFEALGYATRVRDIRSFRKLTGEGVTLIGSDMERILELDLPARFGGSPLDYQVVEEEDERGFTRLTIVVHPALAIPDEQAVVDAVLAALGRQGGASEISRGLWSQANTLRVRREAPRLTAGGKFSTLRVAARSPRPAARPAAPGAPAAR